MAVFKLLATVISFATVMLLDLAMKVDACTCNYQSVCEDFGDADVVVTATAESRSSPAGTYGDITYTLKDTTFHKGNFRPGDEIKFTTAGDSAGCGTYLELEEKYLMGLKLRNGVYWADICGLDEKWSTVSDEDKASVEAGCPDILCDVTCDEFQECLFYNDHIWTEYYCADVCEPSPCGDEEVCNLEQLVACFRPPCPPEAVCRPRKY